MTIPINYSLVQNTSQYPVKFGAMGVDSNVYPKEGEKIVPMQFNFEFDNIYDVDLNIALNSLSISQFRGLYIDNTASLNDVTIFFPMTGFQINVKAGYSNLVSLINFRYNYRFYIFLAGQVYDSVSFVNVFALNFMIPPFNTYQLFGKPPLTWLYNVNNTTLLDTNAPLPQHGIIQGENVFDLTLLKSNLSIYLVGKKPLTIYDKYYSVNLIMKDVFNNKTLFSHTVTNDGSNIVIDSHGIACCVNYFFFKDILKDYIGGTSFNTYYFLYNTVLQGQDGGFYYAPYSYLNWTILSKSGK